MAINKDGVFIICPYPLVCQGLRLLLAQDEDIDVIGTAADVHSALEMLSQLQTRLVLIVSVWTQKDCVAAVRFLKAERPDKPVLVLSPDTRPEQVQATLLAGATGYLPFCIVLDEFVRAIGSVGRGELIVHMSIVPPLLDYLARQTEKDKKSVLDDLSPRQQEVLACLPHGLSDRDIAQKLFISVRTVQTHLAQIYEKLGVHSRTEAAVLAVRTGWFSEKRPDQ